MTVLFTINEDISIGVIPTPIFEIRLFITISIFKQQKSNTYFEFVL